MKTITILTLAFLLSSCAAQMGPKEYVEVYRTRGLGGVSPAYLILKPYDKTYDEYSFMFGCGTMGDFEIKGDTLCLVPKYEYGYGYGLRLKKVDSEGSATSVPMLLKIKKNRLIDITDYKKYPKLLPLTNGDAEDIDYIRIKFRKKESTLWVNNTLPTP